MLEEDKDQYQESSEKEEDILREARDRMMVCVEAWSKNRERMLEDVRFRDGDQWPASIRQERDAEDRPCLTLNLTEMFIDQVVGDQRQNKPGIRVSPVDGKGVPGKVKNLAGDKDYEIADVYTGLIRNIEYASKAESAYDTAFDHAAGHGMGYFRVITEYSDDDTFDQDIRIRRIKNPFTVYLDPSFEDDVAADSMYGFIAQWMPRKEFEKRYGKDSCMDIGEGIGEAYEHWYDHDRVRTAEYFRKVAVEKEIALIHTGEVFDLGETKDRREQVKQILLASGAQIIKTRAVKSHKVEWCKLNGSHILSPCKTFPSKYIPIIPVFGKELNIEGDVYYRGVIRHAKDSQRLLNYWESTAAEIVALQPRAPYIGTVKQFTGLEEYWRTSNVKNHAYLPFNPDPHYPGRPQREAPPMIPAGVIERSRSAYENMLNTTGINRAGLGQVSNEKSGKAILARQREGDTATFSYTDNLAKSIAHCGRILVDMIPRIYDTERVVRIRKPDDSEDFVRINQTLPGGTKVHDLGIGKYDVVVSVGPSYNTQRQEASEAMMEFLRVVPEARGAIMDRVAAAMDWPEADEITKRLRKLLPPAILDDRPDNAPPSPPPPPSPEQQAEMAKAQAEQAKAKAAIAKAEADIVEAKAKMIQMGMASNDAVSEMVAGKVAELFQQLGIVQPQPSMRMPHGVPPEVNPMMASQEMPQQPM